MLECYKVGQPVFYNVAHNAIVNNKISHAYIFDANGNSSVMQIVIDFVKEIVCLDIDDVDQKKNICERIDNGNYMDVKIIKPDGMWIKKDQMLNLQNEFNNKAIEGNKKIYIIKAAEKMNVQTANSLLKFLEEPVDDIIAILVTDNINLLLPTIISRCQLIKLNGKQNFSDIFDYLSDLFLINDIDDSSIEQKNKFIDDVMVFINSIEYNGLNTLIYTKKLVHKNFNDRVCFSILFDLMIKFYYDVLRFKNGLSILYFNNFKDFIDSVADFNSSSRLCFKINVLNDAIIYNKYNLNLNLFIDKLIIDMCGDN